MKIQKPGRTPLARKLQACRKVRGLTQFEASELIGIAQSKLCMYEIGAYEPTISAFLKICKVYDISIEFMLKP